MSSASYRVSQTSCELVPFDNVERRALWRLADDS